MVSDGITDAVDREVPPANTKLVRFAGRRFVVSRPNQRQFGHFGIEMLYALAYARLVEAPVVFVKDHAPRVGHALFEIESDEVVVLRSRWWRGLGVLFWTISEHWWHGTVVSGMRKQRAAALEREARWKRLPKGARVELKRRAHVLRKGLAARGKKVPQPSYNRRRLLATPLRTHLTPAAARHAGDLAASVGIEPDRPLICLHVRERGFKLGFEMQDKGATWDDSVRNAHIETHFPVIDLLVARGYTVVRTGDPSMTPLTRPGTIDLATDPRRDALLELHCLLRSRFILCGESGPYSVSFLTNTPLLAVNCTDPIGAFPVRPDGIYLLKQAVDRDTGQALRGLETLAADRLANLRDPLRYEFLENTPDEIRDATEEMLDLLDHGTPETEAQTRYREVLTATAREARGLYYVRKHGPDRGYLGFGRLARRQADAWVRALDEQLESQSA